LDLALNIAVEPTGTPSGASQLLEFSSAGKGEVQPGASPEGTPGVGNLAAQWSWLVVLVLPLLAANPAHPGGEDPPASH